MASKRFTIGYLIRDASMHGDLRFSINFIIHCLRLYRIYESLVDDLIFKKRLEIKKNI